MARPVTLMTAQWGDMDFGKPCARRQKEMGYDGLEIMLFAHRSQACGGGHGTIAMSSKARWRNTASRRGRSRPILWGSAWVTSGIRASTTCALGACRQAGRDPQMGGRDDDVCPESGQEHGRRRCNGLWDRRSGAYWYSFPADNGRNDRCGLPGNRGPVDAYF